MTYRFVCKSVTHGKKIEKDSVVTDLWTCDFVEYDHPELCWAYFKESSLRLTTKQKMYEPGQVYEVEVREVEA